MELMQASNQWASRPDDERFVNLLALQDHVRGQRAASVQRVVPASRLLAAPVADDETGKRLVVIERDSGAPVAPTHWSFGQMCGHVGAPSAYLRGLPAPMAADCINYGLAVNGAAGAEMGVMLRNDGYELPSLAAATGPNYGRIWNEQIVDSLVKQYGDGISGDFRVPGEFGEEVEITKANTTLYAGDRDMFVFLADEEHRIEVPDRRNGQPGSLARGFFVWNSEVGAATLGIATFLFDYVCCNRIVWGATEFQEVRIRHTGGAPDRWLSQVVPGLQRYAASSSASITEAIAHAKAHKIGEKERVTEFLNKRFTKAQAKAIVIAHEVEEQRPIETLWDVTVGASAYAKSIEFQDERVAVERLAGKVLAEA